jgi:hypothetical protein
MIYKELSIDQFRLADTSRIWIYQCNRDFTNEEVDEIAVLCENFTSQWAAHGHKLMADFRIILNRFIVLAVDEQIAHASGCSIDKSVHFFKGIENQFNVQLMNRLNIACWDTTQKQLSTFSIPNIEKALNEGKLHTDSLVFDNTVLTLGEWENNWIKPLSQTWLSRNFTKV